VSSCQIQLEYSDSYSDSLNTERVLVQTQLSIVQFQELTSCEQCSVKEKLPAQNLQLCFNCDIRRLAFVCYQPRNCVLYLLCVISTIVPINFLVKSGESTFILVALPSKTRDNIKIYTK
jgi:hypothetical protein